MDKRGLIKISGWMVIAAFCFSLDTVAMAKESLQEDPTGQAEKKKEIELEVVWEKQFDEPVVDVIFDETEMTIKEVKKFKIKDLEKIKNMEETEKVKVKYPKVVITKKAIKFLDIEENQKKLIPLEEFDQATHNQNYILIHGRWGLEDKPTRISVYNLDGNVAWEKKNIITGGKTGILHCELSQSGQAAVFYGDVGHSPCGEIYDSKGGLISKIRKGNKGNVSIKEFWPEMGTAFLENGEFVTVGVVTNTSGFVILCFKKDGDIKWIYKPEGEPEKIRVSPLSNFIIVENIVRELNTELNTYKWFKYLTIISENGLLLHNENLNNFIGVPTTLTDSAKIEIGNINETKEKIEFTVGYKNIVRKFEVKVRGGKK